MDHRDAPGSTPRRRSSGRDQGESTGHRLLSGGVSVALLEFKDVFAGYGETEILHGVSGTVEQGEIVTVIGPNGAGKSTLIKTIIGILKPSRGAIRCREVEIAGRQPEDLVTDGLAYIPQTHNIFPTLTVRENLEMGAITRRPGWLHQAGEALAPIVSRFRLRRPRCEVGVHFPQGRLPADKSTPGSRPVVSLSPTLRPRRHRRAEH